MFRWCIRLLPLALMGAFTWMSHQQVLPGGMEFPHPWDKLAHGSAYAVLGAVAALAWGRPSRRALVLVWGILVAFGALDEIHQSFVPGRSCSLGDWGADATGSGLGVLAAGSLLRRRARRMAAA